MRAVNLIPLDQRGGAGPAAGRSGGGAYAVPVLLAALALFTLFYGTAKHEISTRTTEAAAIAVQTQQAQSRAAALVPYTSFLKLREERVNAVTVLADSRFDWAYAFHELGRVLPSNASISTLSGTVGSPTAKLTAASASAATTATVSVTSATPPGSVPTFVLSGCATSQAEVARTLNHLRLINGVSEAALQSSTKPTGGETNSSGGCPGHDPTFAMTVTFSPLPAVSATTTTATPKGSAGGAG